MKNQTNHIEAFKKNNSFSIPDGYFEELPQQIQDKIIKNKTTYFTLSFKTIGSIASILIISSIFLFYPHQKAEYNQAVDNSDIYQYLVTEENILYSQDNIIYNEYEKSLSNTTANNQSISNEEDNIIDYLLSENDPYYYE